MQRVSIFIVAIALVVAGMAAFAADETPPAPAPAPAAKPELSDAARISYSMGVQMGSSVKKANVELDRAKLIQGIEDALDAKPLLMSEEEIKKAMMDFQKSYMAKQQEDQKKQTETNAAEQKTFLEENGKKEGVVTLPDGLQYKVLTEGTGAVPKSTDKVKVNYRGTFVSGEEFDSSYKRNAPAEFQVNGVVKGWTEALQLMKAGSKWQLFVPADLAYGPKGRPGIGPNKMLIFEVELLEVVPSGAVEVPSQPAAPAAPGGTIKLK